MYQNSQRKGLTIIELTLVIGIMVILISTTTIGISYYKDWSQGLSAGEDLKAVYQAQRLFLADNPTTALASLTSSDITPYLPNGMAAIPTVTDLNGGTRTIIITVSPPTLSGGYDPSSSTSDSVWDAGK